MQLPTYHGNSILVGPLWMKWNKNYQTLDKIHQNLIIARLDPTMVKIGYKPKWSFNEHLNLHFDNE